MSIFLNECYKLFSKSRLVVITLVLAAVCLIMTARQPASNFYSDSAIRKLNNDLARLTDQEKAEYLDERAFEYEIYLALNRNYFGDGITEDPRALKYIESYEKNGAPLNYADSLISESLLYYDTLDRINEIITYDKYLDTIEQQGRQMLSISIFGEKDSYEYRNIQKSLAAYRRLRGIVPVYGPSQGIVSATNNQLADIFALVSLLMAVSVLIIEEKEKSLSQILRCTRHGGRKLAYSKLGAVLVWSLAVTLVFFGGNLLCGAVRFGLGDLSRPIQSVKGFLGCTLKITVLQYLVIHYISKFLSLFVIGAFFSLVFTIAGDPVFAYGTAIGALSIEYALYTVIPRASILSPVKYINIAALTQTGPIFHTYSSLNMLSFPVNLITASIISMVIISVLLLLLTVRCTITQKNVIWSPYKVPALLHRLNPFKGRSVSLFTQELYKSFIANKALIVLLVLAVYQYHAFTTFTAVYNEDDRYYKKYADRLNGPLTQETYDFLKQEQNRFDELYAAMSTLSEKHNAGEITDIQMTISYMSIQQSLAPQGAFERLKSQVKYIEEQNPEAQIVYDGGYNQLFAGKGYRSDMNTVLLTMLFLILMISPMYNAGKASSLIISASRNGHGKLFKVRCLVSLMIAALVFILTNVPFFINVMQEYGVSNLPAPVQSIDLLRGLNADMTLLDYLILVYGTRLFFTLLVSVLMLITSSLLKNTIAVFAVNMAVFAAPAVLYFLSLPNMADFLFNALVGTNSILRKILF